MSSGLGSVNLSREDDHDEFGRGGVEVDVEPAALLEHQPDLVERTVSEPVASELAPPPAAPVVTDSAIEPTLDDAAEIARQLANLSPRAAKAVAAAAKATTEEEREAALAAIEAEDDTVNRGLLLRFLGSVDS